MATWFPSMAQPAPKSTVTRWLLEVNDRGECVIRPLDHEGRAGNFAACDVKELHRWLAQAAAGQTYLKCLTLNVDKYLCGSLFNQMFNRWREVVGVMNGKACPAKKAVDAVRNLLLCGGGRERPLDRYIRWDGGARLYVVTEEAAALDAQHDTTTGV